VVVDVYYDHVSSCSRGQYCGRNALEYVKPKHLINAKNANESKSKVVFGIFRVVSNNSYTGMRIERYVYEMLKYSFYHN